MINTLATACQAGSSALNWPESVAIVGVALAVAAILWAMYR